jgi:hypothetical protein
MKALVLVLLRGCGGGIIEVIIDFEDRGLGKIRNARDELKRQQGRYGGCERKPTRTECKTVPHIEWKAMDCLAGIFVPSPPKLTGFSSYFRL